jgi:hypothetical protein
MAIPHIATKGYVPFYDDPDPDTDDHINFHLDRGELEAGFHKLGERPPAISNMKELREARALLAALAQWYAKPQTS